MFSCVCVCVCVYAYRGSRGVSSVRCKFLMAQHCVANWGAAVTAFVCAWLPLNSMCSCVPGAYISVCEHVHISVRVCAFESVCCSTDACSCVGIICMLFVGGVAVCQLGQGCNHKARWSTLNNNPVPLPASQRGEWILRGAKPVHKCAHLAVLVRIKWNISWLQDENKGWILLNILAIEVWFPFALHRLCQNTSLAAYMLFIYPYSSILRSNLALLGFGLSLFKVQFS